jgi:hypothetical protein
LGKILTILKKIYIKELGLGKLRRARGSSEQILSSHAKSDIGFLGHSAISTRITKKYQ